MVFPCKFLLNCGESHVAVTSFSVSRHLLTQTFLRECINKLSKLRISILANEQYKVLNYSDYFFQGQTWFPC